MLYSLGIQGTLYPLGLLGLNPGLITAIINFLPCLSVTPLVNELHVESLAATASLTPLIGQIQIEALATAIAIVTLATMVSVNSQSAKLSVEGGEC
jgi:hypothetical protein